MKNYVGMDLHSNNTVIAIADEKDNRLFKKKFPNDLALILEALEPRRSTIEMIAVESTFNWYWLVDGLLEAGYPTVLAHPAGMEQYRGLKNSNDGDDAFWLAHLLRLDILPQGYIYPKEQRQVRDLLRKRLILVHHSTTHILSFQSLMNRNASQSISSNAVKKLKPEDIEGMLDNEFLVLSAQSNIAAIHFFAERIKHIEKKILTVAKLLPPFQKLMGVPGIGKILALTIALETGDMNRFKSAGNYASYCRCVQSRRESNGKKKGENNRKNGNKYLAWAFVEAANFSRRYCKKALAFYNKKLAKRNKNVATKALACKICKACYHVMKENIDYSPDRVFG